jgi:copper chaperone CopZ
MKKAILMTAGLALPLALLSVGANAKDVQYELRVDGMTCPFCAATSEKALEKIEGVNKVSTDLKKATISVCATEEAELTDEKLAELLKKKGFTYVSKTKQETCTLTTDKKHS